MRAEKAARLEAQEQVTALRARVALLEAALKNTPAKGQGHSGSVGTLHEPQGVQLRPSNVETSSQSLSPANGSATTVSPQGSPRKCGSWLKVYMYEFPEDLPFMKMAAQHLKECRDEGKCDSQVRVCLLSPNFNCLSPATRDNNCISLLFLLLLC